MTYSPHTSLSFALCKYWSTFVCWLTAAKVGTHKFKSDLSNQARQLSYYICIILYWSQLSGWHCKKFYSSQITDLLCTQKLTSNFSDPSARRYEAEGDRDTLAVLIEIVITAYQKSSVLHLIYDFSASPSCRRFHFGLGVMCISAK